LYYETIRNTSTAMEPDQKIKPSDSELLILQVLWQQGPSTVKEVNEQLSKEKPTGYTTTLKLMQIMYEKGLVDRTSEGAKGRSHIYSAAVKEAQISRHLLNSFVDRVFQGSVSKLVLRALGNTKTTQEEIAQIRAFLDKIEKENPS
jgi:BlaI family transcriptional regulator, penicillinase repressor